MHSTQLFTLFRIIWFHISSVFILLLAISKRSKLQEPDCIHSGDNLTKINFSFLKFPAYLEAEISLVEVVGILISKVVQ